MANEVVPYVAPKEKEEPQHYLILIAVLLFFAVVLLVMMAWIIEPRKAHAATVHQDNTYGGERGKPDARDWEDVGGGFYEPKKKPKGATGMQPQKVNAVMSRGTNGSWWVCQPVQLPQRR